MLKTKQKSKIQTRDWAIIILFLLIIVTNFWWWSINNVHDSVENDLHATNSRQLTINQKLKACIDEVSRSCDISTPN
jgi:hypothetical protein